MQRRSLLLLLLLRRSACEPRWLVVLAARTALLALVRDGAYHGGLVLCGLSDQTLLGGEGDIGGGGAVTLIVGNDLHLQSRSNTAGQYEWRGTG